MAARDRIVADAMRPVVLPVATTLTGDDDRRCDVTVAIIPATVSSFA